VLRHPYRRGKQISMCGLLGYRTGSGDQDEQVATWMRFGLLEGAYDTRQFIRVLDGLCGLEAVERNWPDLWGRVSRASNVGCVVFKHSAPAGADGGRWLLPLIGWQPRACS
jgi:hypothetical protein